MIKEQLETIRFSTGKMYTNKMFMSSSSIEFVTPSSRGAVIRGRGRADAACDTRALLTWWATCSLEFG